jgi:hypothetical protein
MDGSPGDGIRKLDRMITDAAIVNMVGTGVVAY